MPITVLIVDDHLIVRNGLRRVLERTPGIDVAGEAGDGRAAVAIACKCRPDVVLMDVAMPGLNGIDATRSIVGQLKQTKVIALSGLADRSQVDAMLLAGASGYLLKDCGLDELVLAIRRVAAGGKFLGSGVTDIVINGFLKRESTLAGAGGGALSEPEQDVLRLLAGGLSTSSIAEEIGIGDKAVDALRAGIMDKLDLHTVAELTKYAIREGLTSLDT